MCTVTELGRAQPVIAFRLINNLYSLMNIIAWGPQVLGKCTVAHLAAPICEKHYWNIMRGAAQ